MPSDALEVLALVSDATERELLQAAAPSRPVALRCVEDAGAALVALEQRWPEVLVLALGHHEEEAALLCRAARRRATDTQRPLRIVMVDRGAALVESEDEAAELGADALLGDLDAESLLDHLVGPQPRTAPEHTPSLPSPRRTTPATADHDAIAEMLERIRHADYFAILGVHPDAEPNLLAEAYISLRQRFTPRDTTPPHQQAALTEITEALADAWHILGDPRLRARYRAAFGRSQG